MSFSADHLVLDQKRLKSQSEGKAGAQENDQRSERRMSASADHLVLCGKLIERQFEEKAVE